LENEGKALELRDIIAHVSEVEAHAAVSERELIADLTAKQNMAVKHMDERLGSLKDQLAQSLRTRDELRESVDALQAQLTEARSECRAHKGEVDKMRNESTSLHKEIALLKLRVTTQAAADESHGLRRRIEELEEQIKAARCSLEASRCSLEQVETRSEQKLRRQKNLLDQTFEKLKQRTDEVSAFKKERDGALERLEKQKIQLLRLEREISLLERDRLEAKNELKSCRLSLKEKDKNKEQVSVCICMYVHIYA
jgi:chromosome segregation ATPase